MLSFSFISLLGYSELLTSSLLTQGTLHKPLPLPEMLFPLAIYKVRSLHSLDVRLSVTSAERPSLTTHLKAVCPFTLYHSTQFIYRLSPSPGYKVYEGRNRVYLVEHCLSSAELKAWNVVGIKKKKVLGMIEYISKPIKDIIFSVSQRRLLSLRKSDIII